MSVTFTAELRENDIAGYGLTCSELQYGQQQEPTAEYASYPEAHEALAQRTSLCGSPCEAERCLPRVALIERDPAPVVNMANANAARVLETLGYPDEELGGDEEAEVFFGAVLLASGLTPYDEGIPAHQEGNVIDCGRRPGYLQDRLDELRELASWCYQRGRRVQWC